jgi:hypothetical protein
MWRIQISRSLAALKNVYAEMDIIPLGKLLEIITQFQPKRVLVIMNLRSISHGLMKDDGNY